MIIKVCAAETVSIETPHQTDMLANIFAVIKNRMI
jgi:hypothetical protein